MKEIIRAIENWNDDRPTIKENNTLDTLKQLITSEVYELVEDGANLREEVSDVFIYALSIFRILAEEAGQDTHTYVNQAIMEKVSLNILQYEAHRFQDGSYEEQRTISKKHVYDTDLKRKFYE